MPVSGLAVMVQSRRKLQAQGEREKTHGGIIAKTRQLAQLL